MSSTASGVAGMNARSQFQSLNKTDYCALSQLFNFLFNHVDENVELQLMLMLVIMIITKLGEVYIDLS